MVTDAEVTSVYIDLENATLKETQKKATENAKANYGEDGDSSLYDPTTVHFNVSEAYIDDKDGDLNLKGEVVITETGEKLAYLSLTIRLKTGALIDVLQQTTKLYNKVKTVLEAAK